MMIRFPFLERFGVTAVMSDISDGDCCSRVAAESFTNSAIQASHRSLRLVHQVHGVDIVDSTECAGNVEADGIIAGDAGVVLGIRVADCVPILIYDPVRNVGALVHAGRKGTQKRIAGAAISALLDRYDSRATDLIALIGPSAGPCCYEVGVDVLEEFVREGGVSHGTHLDLWESNRDQLTNSGVLTQNIQLSATCTICSDTFYSYRRTGTSSRNLVILANSPDI